MLMAAETTRKESERRRRVYFYFMLQDFGHARRQMPIDADACIFPHAMTAPARRDALCLLLFPRPAAAEMQDIICAAKCLM